MRFMRRIARFVLGEAFGHLILEKAKCWMALMLVGGPISQVLFAGFMAFSFLHAWFLMHHYLG
jgi:hypothetical protein